MLSRCEPEGDRISKGVVAVENQLHKLFGLTEWKDYSMTTFVITSPQVSFHGARTEY